MDDHLDRVLGFQTVSRGQRALDVNRKVLHGRQVVQPVGVNPRELREITAFRTTRDFGRFRSFTFRGLIVIGARELALFLVFLLLIGVCKRIKGYFKNTFFLCSYFSVTF
jgi:hypothetical protein